MPVGLLVTVPVPAPDFVTDSWYSCEPVQTSEPETVVFVTVALLACGAAEVLAPVTVVSLTVALVSLPDIFVTPIKPAGQPDILPNESTFRTVTS